MTDAGTVVGFYPGDYVKDRYNAPDEGEPDERPTLLVMAVTATPADEYEIGNGKTVADANPREYAESVVLECVFPGRTDADLANAKRYGYPAARLERVASPHEVDNQ